MATHGGDGVLRPLFLLVKGREQIIIINVLVKLQHHSFPRWRLNNSPWTSNFLGRPSFLLTGAGLGLPPGVHLVPLVVCHSGYECHTRTVDVVFQSTLRMVEL